MDERDVRLLKGDLGSRHREPRAASRGDGIPVSTIHYRLNNLRTA